MANDRIWLSCPYCEELKLLYKYYPGNNGYMWRPEEVEDWMNKHLTECHGAKWDLNGSPGIVLITDSMTKQGSSGALSKEIVEQIKDACV